jgi:hyperosmotically inducible periplasmic protein
MTSIHRRAGTVLACFLLSASIGCSRSRESSPNAGANGKSGGAVKEDVRQLARATGKTAEDLGHATADTANKAGQQLGDVAKKAGAGGEDAWLTTKVKAELARESFDPLRVHVDTEGKVVTLSGTVDSVALRDKAVAAAAHVEGVARVSDHLFVQPAAK